MKDEIKEAIEALPKTNNTISAYGSIDINELYKTIEKFKKVPDYNELMKDNNNLQQKVEQLEKENKELNKQLEQKDKEINRLNNIINELEKWCNECIDYNIISRKNGYTTISDEFFEIVLDKLKALKEE